MNPHTKIFLIRHAEVEVQYHRVFAGRMDVGLSPAGQAQALHLAAYLRRQRLDVLCASPMRRVRETMAPLMGECGPTPEFFEPLREFDFGAWTGLDFLQVRERYGADPWDWLEWIEGSRIPNGESGAQIRARIEPWLRETLARHQGKSIAIFAHGGVIRMLLALLLDLPLTKMACFDVEYAGVTELDLAPGRHPEIQMLNYTPWKMAALNA
jgi:broad specificity phosphatase PhoE